MFPLAPHTIFITLAGSQAHGTAREGSDVDLRGVCIAPLAIRLSLFRVFEQHEGPLDETLQTLVLPRLEAHPTASRGLHVKTESVLFDLAKFIGLCSVANPNALEILFADPRDWVLETPSWRKLYAERFRFLTKKVQQTFHGNAIRDGAWTFDALLEQTERLRVEMEEAARRSVLPADVDRPFIDSLVYEMLATSA